MTNMEIPGISVLMSIYNETESMINESVISILNQTYRNFEFIIICDKPDRDEEIREIINRFDDSRIRLFYNSENIGLAMSMNKAASLAAYDIFARMDSDDIAEFDRFERELAFLNNGYDFVFSNYILIDENSKVLDQHMPIYDNVGIERRISLDPSIIHHPTVMFTKGIFDKVGGYRDFPCSQDADLWLRMQEAGAKFYMLPECLLKYRINNKGISGSKWMRQQLTIHYIIELSIQRLQIGVDSFNTKEYERYMEKHGVNNLKAEVSLRKGESMLLAALNDRQNGNIIASFIKRICVLLSCPTLRHYYKNILKKKYLLRIK